MAIKIKALFLTINLDSRRLLVLTMVTALLFGGITYTQFVGATGGGLGYGYGYGYGYGSEPEPPEFGYGYGYGYGFEPEEEGDGGGGSGSGGGGSASTLGGGGGGGGGGAGAIGEVLGATTSAGCRYFLKDLTLASTGDDVTDIQTFLVDQAAGPAAQALAAAFAGGTPKGFFGPLTQAALAEYQAANGILPADGFFGPTTRAHILTVCNLSDQIEGLLNQLMGLYNQLLLLLQQQLNLLLNQ